MKSRLDLLQGLVRSYLNNRYEEGTSIARGGEEQLDMKMDVKLDKELDMKIFHGRAREEREACAREEEEIQAGPASSQTGRHTGAPGHRPGPTGRYAGPTPTPTGRPADGNRTGYCRARPAPGQDAQPGLNRSLGLSPADRPQTGRVRVCRPIYSGDEKIVNQENKNFADLMTWREYEALRNEMRREFRTQDYELRGTVQGISQKLDTTSETVNTMKDQMTDIQHTLQVLQMSVENLTNQQQQEDEDLEPEDEALGVGRGLGRGNRGRGFAELGRRGRGLDEDDGLGKPKFSIPKFEGGDDVEEYLTWELKIEK
ncbi:hypothetical protein QYE76_040474 [Lolium multiflorum]|uniref:Uncharacterized protein n=1 Tax=Lolium multiflorum TaxID=4521 RepID=A0AAD8TBT2_LOLMU|nr:hypothetical protein QYE76_040474 [Lolium multiflorum]